FCSTLMNKDTREDYILSVKKEYDKARESHLNKRSDKRYKNIDEARAEKFQINPTEVVPEPTFTGTKIFNDFPLEELVPYIDWTPFFHTWELKGSYPRIMADPKIGIAATKLYEDAQVLLGKIVSEKL